MQTKPTKQTASQFSWVLDEPKTYVRAVAKFWVFTHKAEISYLNRGEYFYEEHINKREILEHILSLFDENKEFYKKYEDQMRSYMHEYDENLALTDEHAHDENYILNPASHKYVHRTSSTGIKVLKYLVGTLVPKRQRQRIVPKEKSPWSTERIERIERVVFRSEDRN
jgi:hypothetical protein